MPEQPFRHFRRAIRRVAQAGACAASAMLLATPPALAREPERGVEPVHQPVVERSDFVFDVAGGRDGALDATEARRLSAWFDALDLRYGDHVAIAGTKGYDLAALRTAVGEIVARYGLLTEADAPITAGDPPAGALRVVISRSTVSVPGCPSWRDTSQTDFTGGLSDNYGCAMARNLAAMIADPQDLVVGRTTTSSRLRTATGSRAIEAYRAKEPSGAGGLQVMSAGGQ
jgi:pilus assembly protein CpaD